MLLDSRASVDDVKAGDTAGIVIGTDNVFHRVLSVTPVAQVSTGEVDQGMGGNRKAVEK